MKQIGSLFTLIQDIEDYHNQLVEEEVGIDPVIVILNQQLMQQKILLDEFHENIISIKKYSVKLILLYQLF